MKILTNLAFNTEPCLVHSPGTPIPNPGPFFDLLECLREAKPRWESCKDLFIFTLNAPPHGRPEKPAGIFERELMACGVEVHVCREGNYGDGYELGTKLTQQIEILKSTDAEYSLFADSCDVLMVNSPQETLDKFKRMNVEMLFCPDMGFGFPPDPVFTEFLFSRPDYNEISSINSGIFIGKTKSLRSFLECAESKETQIKKINDQCLVQKAFVEWEHAVKIDTRMEIMQNLHQYRAAQLIKRPATDHAQALASLVRKLPITDRIFGIEIGVFEGQTSSHLFAEFPNLFLWLCDPWKHGKSSMVNRFCQKDFDKDKAKTIRYTEFAWNRRIICPDLSIDVLAYCSDESFHFGFVDADHSYPKVRQDIISLWPKIKKGGFASGHDYSWDGVKQAVHEFCDAKKLTLNVSSGDVWSIVKS